MQPENIAQVIYVIDEKLTELSAVHSANCIPPLKPDRLGKLIDVSEVQPLKAPWYILLTFGKYTEESAVQPANANAPMVEADGKLIDVRDVQLSNVPPPIETILEKEAVLRAEQPANIYPSLHDELRLGKYADLSDAQP